MTSFSTYLFRPYRGQGIGTKLMLAMLTELAAAGYQRAAFSVKKESPALRLYQRIGFKIVGDGADDTEWLMVHDLRKINLDTPEVKEHIDNLTDSGAAFEVSPRSPH